MDQTRWNDSHGASLRHRGRDWRFALGRPDVAVGHMARAVIGWAGACHDSHRRLCFGVWAVVGFVGTAVLIRHCGLNM